LAWKCRFIPPLLHGKSWQCKLGKYRQTLIDHKMLGYPILGHTQMHGPPSFFAFAVVQVITRWSRIYTWIFRLSFTIRRQLDHCSRHAMFFVRNASPWNFTAEQVFNLKKQSFWSKKHWGWSAQHYWRIWQLPFWTRHLFLVFLLDIAFNLQLSDAPSPWRFPRCCPPGPSPWSGNFVSCW
jgi:hypothetical protein